MKTKPNNNEWQDGATMNGYVLVCSRIAQKWVAQRFADVIGGECWPWGGDGYCVVRKVAS